MKLLISDNKGQRSNIDISHHEDGYSIVWEDGTETIAQAKQIRDNLLHLFVDGRSVDVPFLQDGDSWEVAVDTVPFRYEIQDPRDAAMGASGAGGAAEGMVSVNMPGKVVQVLVSEGDRVAEGQGVVVVEAMKMENELKAPCDGVVAVIHVAPGDAVESGQSLLQITADDA